MGQGKIIYHNTQKILGDTPSSLTGSPVLNTRSRNEHTTDKNITEQAIAESKQSINSLTEAINSISKGIEYLETTINSLSISENFLLKELHKSLGVFLGIEKEELREDIQVFNTQTQTTNSVSTESLQTPPIKRRRKGRKPGPKSKSKPKE